MAVASRRNQLVGHRIDRTELRGPPQVSDGQGQSPIAHDSFDNDVAVLTESIAFIRGAPLAVPVENLRGF